MLRWPSTPDLEPSTLSWGASAILLLLPWAAQAQEVRDLPGSDRALTPTISAEYVVGAMNGDDWEMFGERLEVDFDAEGNLYVFDTDNARIVKVSPEGEFLMEFGGAGGGPGELRMPMGFVVTSQDEVVVTDLGNRAFVVYGTDGTYLRNVPLDLGLGLPGAGTLADPVGGLISPPGGIRIQMGGPGGGEEAEPGLPIQRFSLEENSPPQELYRAWEPPDPGEGPGTTLEGEGGMSFSMGGMPRMEGFRPEVHLGLTPDGTLILADSSTWALKVVSSEGQLSQVLRRSIQPQPVTERIQRAEKQRRLDDLEANGSSRRVRMITAGGEGGGGGTMNLDASKMMQGQIDGMVFAEEIPVVAGLGVDQSGTIWVQRTSEELGEDGPMDFVSSDGDYLGTAAPGAVRIPESFGPDGLAAYVEEDELGVKRVEVVTISGLRYR